eukprot:TRINITY_DN550_c0_g1_i1.p1 TRINITY_DN550_c0_g1~~TRINITY_DN550_c0_g1_i1.p1  ORF type:complete len:2591 (+),score=755.90 TRINITY_DN550_c0_g1_i1:291-8063(+)
MSLPLKINLVNKNVSRVMKFAPTMYVIEAIRQIRDKTEEGGEDHGLFQPATTGARAARWLKEDRMLSYFELQPNDELEYKKKHRPLKVKLPDETIKTILIDDTNTVEEIVLAIGEKLNMASADEFSLKLDGAEDWLTQTKPLHEQGVADDTILIFKKKFYITDSQVSMDDPIALHLVYVESRDAILNGNHPCTQSEAVMFAALQCQVVVGNWSKDRKIDCKDFLPVAFHKHIKKLEPMIYNEHKKVVNTKETSAKYRYVQLCRSLKTYGITFFIVKQNTRNSKKANKVKLGVTRDGLLIADEDGETCKEYNLTQLRRWAAAPTVLTLDFGDHEDDYMTLQTEKAEEISKLLGGYIDLLLKKRNDSSMTLEQEENLIASEEPVAPIKSMAISSITTSLVGGFNGFGVQQHHGGAPGMNAAKGASSGASQRAVPTNLATAQAYLTNLASDFSNRGEMIPRNAALTTLQWKKQLLNNSDGISKALGNLMQVLPPNRFDKHGMDSRACELANSMQGLVSAARNAAVRKDGTEDQDMIHAASAVIDALKVLMDSTNELASDPTNPLLMQKLIKSQKAVEAAISYMNSACRGVIVDEPSQKLFTEASKGVANASRDLLGLTEAHPMNDPTARANLITAANRVKALGDAVQVEASALAPAIMADAVKNQFKATTAEILKTVSAMRAFAHNPDESTPIGFGMKSLADAIAQLLSAAELAEIQTSGKQFTGPAGVIFDETAKLMAAQGRPDVINNSNRQILTASMKLVSAAKAQAEEVDDETRAQLLSGAQSIAELTIKLKNSAALAAANLADPNCQMEMENAAQRLADAAMTFVGDSIEKAALHNLRSNAKLTAAATIQLASASRSAAITCQDPATIQLLRQNAQNALNATNRLLQSVQTYQRNPENISSQEAFIKESQECQPQYKLVSAAKQSIPKVNDSTNKNNLKQAADNTSEALNKLVASHKALLASRGLAEVDEAVDMIGAEEAGLDGALYDIDSGSLSADYNTSPEGAVQLLTHACKAMAVSGETLSNSAKNDPANFGPSSKEFADAMGNVANASKTLASTTQDKPFQRAVIGSAKDVSREARGLMIASRALTSSPDDQSLDRAVSDAQKRLEDAINKLLASAKGGAGATRDCEEAETAIQNALKGLAMRKGQAKDFPIHAEELENAIKATQTATYSLQNAAKSNPKALGPCAKTTASSIAPLISAASATSGSAPNPQSGNQIINATRESVQSVMRLVSASKLTALQHDENSIKQLEHASSDLSNTLDNLLSLINAASPGQKGTDEASKALVQIASSVGTKAPSGTSDTQSDLAELKRQAARLGETTKNIIVSAKQDPEKLGALSKDAASAVASIARAAEGIASSGGQSSPFSSEINDIRNTTEALAAACESKDPSSKQVIVTSAKNLTTGTQALIAKLKGIMAEDPSSSQFLNPFIQQATTGTTMIVSKAKDAATTKSPQAVQQLKEAKTNLINSLEKLSSYKSNSSGGDHSAKGRRLINAVRETANSTNGMVLSSKEVLKRPTDQNLHNELNTQARNVGVAIKNLLDAAKLLGEADLDEFIEKVSASVADLDSAAISATVGLLENLAPKGKTTQSIEEEIVEQSRDLANGIRDLVVSQKESPASLVKAARDMSELISNLASSSKMAASTVHDPAKQQEGLGLAKGVAESVYQLMVSCKGSDPNEIVSSAKLASASISKLLGTMKGGVIASRDCDDAIKSINEYGKMLSGPAKSTGKSYAESQKELVDMAKEMVAGIAKMVQTSKSNPAEIGTAAKKVAGLIPKFVDSTLDASTSISDQKAKGDLVNAAKEVVSASAKIIYAAKQVASDPKNAKNNQEVSATYKQITDSISSLISSIKAGATGEIKCEQSIDLIGRSIAEMDSAALYAATGGLHPENDDLDIDQIQSALLQQIKSLESSHSSATKAKNLDELGKISDDVSSQFENLSKETKNAASLMNSLLNQQEILMGAKAVGSAEQNFINSAVKVHKDPKDMNAKKEMNDASSKLQNALKEFSSLATSATLAASSGIKELESNRKIVQQLGEDFAKVPVQGQAGASDVLKSAKGLADAVSAIVAGLSSSEDVVKLIQGANDTSVHSKTLIATSKGAVRLTSNPTQGKNLTEAAKRAVMATAAFLDAAKQQRKNQTPENQMAASEASDLVVKEIGELVEASKVLPGSEEALKLFQQTDELEALAEKELTNCANAIEEAARTLIEAKRRQIEARQNRDTPLPEEEITEAILDAAKAIAQATGTLVGAATMAQKELVSKGKTSQTQSVYKRDPAWAKGLISAAQEVAGTVGSLVGAANQVTKGVIEEENLVAAAKGVSGATARLVFASRTKADPFSPTQKKLTEAAKSVTTATQMLVDAAKPSAETVNDNQPDWSNMSQTQARKEELEAQTRILKLQRELDSAQRDLANNRKGQYKDANVNVAADQAKQQQKPIATTANRPPVPTPTPAPKTSAPVIPRSLPQKASENPAPAPVPQVRQQPTIPIKSSSPAGPSPVKSAIAPVKASGSPSAGRSLPAPVASNPSFSLSQLQKRPPPPGVDVKSLEVYLSDQEFQSTFNMSKAEFAKLPTFKRNAEKQKHGLF